MNQPSPPPSTREADTSTAAHSRSPSPLALTPPSPTQSPPYIENDLSQELPISELRHDRISQVSETIRLPVVMDRDYFLREVKSEHDRIRQGFVTAPLQITIDRNNLLRELESEYSAFEAESEQSET